MHPYPHAATDTDFADIRPGDMKPTHVKPAQPMQPEEITEINWRALLLACCGLLLCIAGVVALVGFIVTSR